MFETCYLHIGSQKTGSTSIQHTLKTHTELLEKHGYLYPKLGANHAHMALTCVPNFPRARDALNQAAAKNKANPPTLEDIQSAYRQNLEKACKASKAQNLILSSEHLFILTEDGIRELIEYLSTLAKKIIIIGYVRHPAALAVSSIQQRLKGGRFVMENFEPKKVFRATARRLETYSSVVGDDHMILRPFDRAQLYRANVVADFLKVVGVKDALLDQILLSFKNESLSYEAAMLSDISSQRVSDKAAPIDAATHKAFIGSVKGIRGGKFALSKAQNEALLEAAKPEVKTLKDRFGIELPEPDLPQLGALWGDQTIKDIAGVIHGLIASNQEMQKKLNNRPRGKAKQSQPSAGPTFICPGATKAGTTWLNEQLKLHPDFRMPIQKELDYLGDFPNSRKKYLKRLPTVTERLTGRPGSKARLDWWSLFTSTWDPKKYPSLFEYAQGKLTGDISPNYRGLSTARINKAAALVPNAKIVILLRNPVDRAWSHARHYVSRGPKNTLPEAERLDAMVKFATSKPCFQGGDYATIVGDWTSAFGKKQIGVFYYDKLVSRPAEFLDDILSFLGASAMPTKFQANLGEIINKGEEHPCPEDLREKLGELYAPMLKTLAPMLPENGRPDWLGKRDTK